MSIKYQMYKNKNSLSLNGLSHCHLTFMKAPNFYDFLDFVRLSIVKKIRRRISFDPYPPDIVEYRNLRPPYPPKKVRRLLWTTPCGSYRRKNMYMLRIF